MVVSGACLVLSGFLSRGEILPSEADTHRHGSSLMPVDSL